MHLDVIAHGDAFTHTRRHPAAALRSAACTTSAVLDLSSLTKHHLTRDAADLAEERVQHR